MIAVLRKDLQEFLAGVGAATALFSWMLLILTAIAPLNDDSNNLRVFVDTRPEPAHFAGNVYDRTLKSRLADIPGVEIVEAEGFGDDVWSFADRNDIDIALVWHPALLPTSAPPATMQAGGAWYAYVNSRTERQYKSIELALQLAHAGAVASLNYEKDWDWAASGIFLAGADVLFAAQPYTGSLPWIPPLYVMERDGPAQDTYQYLVPHVILLMANMIAFIYASSSLAKERALGTLHLLLLGGRGASTLLAKAVFPTVISFASLLLMAVFADVALGFTVRPHWLPVMALNFVSLLAVSLQGVTVSALVRSELGAYVVSAAYLVALMLFGGLLVPLPEGWSVASAVADLLPTSHVRDDWRAWMLLGISTEVDGAASRSLFMLTAISLAAAGLSVARFRRSI